LEFGWVGERRKKTGPVHVVQPDRLDARIWGAAD
jgi:mRNA-degrading endonuclease toxin of MazEF toxin-antitoxin module